MWLRMLLRLTTPWLYHSDDYDCVARWQRSGTPKAHWLPAADEVLFFSGLCQETTCVMCRSTTPPSKFRTAGKGQGFGLETLTLTLEVAALENSRFVAAMSSLDDRVPSQGPRLL